MRYRVQILAGLFLMAIAKSGLPAHPNPSPNPIEAKVRRDETFAVQTGDPAMEAAYQRGRATLDQFLAINDNRPPRSGFYAVKIGVHDADRVEWFWIRDFTRKGDDFRGVVDNAPRIVGTVREGQLIDFQRADIVDWMYAQDGRVKGNFSICVLLAKEDPAARAAFLRKIGQDCSA